MYRHVPLLAAGQSDGRLQPGIIIIIFLVVVVVILMIIRTRGPALVRPTQAWWLGSLSPLSLQSSSQ